MSPHDSIAALLSGMGFAELALIFMVVGAYAVAINGSYSSAVRSAAASMAFVAGVAFAALTPSWVAAIAFLAITVLGIAAFAAAAWAISAALGFGTSSGFAADAQVVESDERVAGQVPSLRAARVLAAPTPIRSH